MGLARKGPLGRSPVKSRLGSPRTSMRPAGPRTPGGLRGCAKNLARTGGTGTNVKVVVRVRPPNRREEAANAKLAVKVVDEKMLVFDPKEEEEESFFFRGAQQKGRDMLKRQHKHTEFLFDRVFGYDSTNREVFNESTKDIVTHVLDGYNCSVFVYGATGAGKTFTMLGTEENPGVMFLTMVHLFEKMEELKQERDIEMAVSYLEVYNECVHDLIVKSTPLYLREDANGVVVSGLRVEKISSTNRLFELLAEGNKNRTQHPTDANSESSRSHAVFQVYLKMCNKGSNQKKMVKLSMIDLAGSERGSATNFAGARFKEGSSINKSLLALGNCINKLADGLPHIPYRDSKLTRILKDSLSGNCRTVMIANVSPSSLTFEDTHNTLRYAKRAKLIKSVVKKNIVSVEMHVSHYIKMVDDLKEENARLKADLLKAEAALEASKVANAANPVYVTPVKNAPVQNKGSPDAELSALMAEVESVFAEKEDLQRRYLQMDSNEKVLMFRMQCKERSVARVQQLCETPTNTDEAKFRLGRSMKQFTGQLQSAVGCQENLADKRNELDEKLKRLRHRAVKAGLLDQYLDKTSKMDLQFQNIELKEQLSHLNRVITLMNKEKDDQDQVMTELSAAFRKYFNLLRGHGHMTDVMLKDHKSLVRRLEGLKGVNWETAEAEPSSLKPLIKLSLTGSPAPITTTPKEPQAEPYRSISPIPHLTEPQPRPASPQEPRPPVMQVYRSSTCDIAQLKQDLNLITVMPATFPVEKPVLHESEDEEDFCVTGKFAQFNATFDSDPTEGVQKIDAAISKVEHLLNESSEPINTTFDRPDGAKTEKTGDLNATFDAEPRIENLNTEKKTFEAEKKTCDAENDVMNRTYEAPKTDVLNKTYEAPKTDVVLNKTFDAEKKTLDAENDALNTTYEAPKTAVLNKTFDAEKKTCDDVNKTFEVSEPLKSPVLAAATKTDLRPVAVLLPPKTSPMRDQTDMNSTYQLLSTPVVLAAAAKPEVAKGPPKPRMNSATKNPRVVVNPKRPLQENNFPKPKTVSQALKWRPPTALPSTAKTGLINGPISAKAILERKSPMNPKPKAVVVNKENGVGRRPNVPFSKSSAAGASRVAATPNAK